MCSEAGSPRLRCRNGQADGSASGARLLVSHTLVKTQDISGASFHNAVIPFKGGLQSHAFKQLSKPPPNAIRHQGSIYENLRVTWTFRSGTQLPLLFHPSIDFMTEFQKQICQSYMTYFPDSKINYIKTLNAFNLLYI